MQKEQNIVFMTEGKVMEYLIEVSKNSRRCTSIVNGREEDKKIRKGDVFECIKYLGIGCDDEFAYTRGKVYLSEDNGCITDNFGNHRPWETLDWQNYFKRI